MQTIGQIMIDLTYLNKSLMSVMKKYITTVMFASWYHLSNYLSVHIHEFKRQLS